GRERCERAELDLAGGLGRPHPLDRLPVPAAALDGLGDEPGLADARLAEDNDATGASGRGQRASHGGELGVTAHQRPACEHERIVPTGAAGNYVVATDPAPCPAA